MLNDIALNKPSAQICPLCGNSYGTKSLQFHIKWCRKQWDQKFESQPKIIRKGPHLPGCLVYVCSGRKLSLLEITVYNNIALRCFNKESSVRNYFIDGKIESFEYWEESK